MAGTRTSIVKAASHLLTHGGREAVSSRAVSALAGVQAPTIYRQFGDMAGLLDAVSHETFARYVSQEATFEPTGDPAQDLRRGWDIHVAFGLAHPAVYALMYGNRAELSATSAAQQGGEVLRGLIVRVAQAGRLQVTVDRAAQMIAAAGQGVTLELIATPPESRDLQLATAMREAVMSAILTAQVPEDRSGEQSGPQRVAARAVALNAVLEEAPNVLSGAERQLLAEWLERLANPR
ncbi:helix-turn-helix domain containing protein [Deinococcus sp. ZS9-10]|uniref:Helix-turn-helix domain containing protein n=2 Tax=Deinococcus arenicola TaxID=2994950 RepID=A0ABU4DQK8_9DEIO|nr:helix-turn-helix domain containing protein [Deinococcus sp. ZS9-10]